MLGGSAVPPGLIVSTRKEPMRFSEARGKPILAALDRLQATLRQHAPIDVAIFDPLVYLHEAEENSSSEMSRWLVPLRDACRECGTAPFLVHHAGWVQDGEDARGRGSTAIRAWADLELGLHAITKNGRTLHRLNLVKTNFAERWKEPLTLELNEQTLRFDVVDEAGTLCPPEALANWLREEHDGRWSEKREALYSAICEQFGCEQRTAKRAVKRAKDLGILVDHGQRTPLEAVAYSRTGEA
ncbi:MAG: AAA family ATPase [candidate division NC10 bacterium]